MVRVRKPNPYPKSARHLVKFSKPILQKLKSLNEEFSALREKIAKAQKEKNDKASTANRRSLVQLEKTEDYLIRQKKYYERYGQTLKRFFSKMKLDSQNLISALLSESYSDSSAKVRSELSNFIFEKNRFKDLFQLCPKQPAWLFSST